MFARTPIWLLAGTAIIAVSAPTPALSEDYLSYPHLVGGGADTTVEYGAEQHGTTVGGGFARIVKSGPNETIDYAGPAQAQRPPFAHVVSSDDDMRIVYSYSSNRDTALAEAGSLPSVMPSAIATVRVLADRQG